jgi:hypothetical protein
MYKYVAYGIGIHSDLPLPELVPSQIESKITIRFGKVADARPIPCDAPHWAWAAHEEIVLYWRQVGTFLIRKGQEIIIDPDSAAPAERVRLFLLGAAMGVLLYQRGLLVFHASAVALKHGAIAFLGSKGAGKSTITAALHMRGHSMIADDVMAIDFAEGRPKVLPGFPQIKLWPDALASIGHKAEAFPRLQPNWEKRDYRVTSGFSEKPLSVQALFVLDHGPQLVIEPLPASQALLGLLPHWYCVRFGTEVLQQLDYGTHFLQCARLARCVPVYRLSRPRSISALSEVAQLLEEYETGDREETC